ncbi:MAG: 3-oxoacyl-[acyl-carrier-protein] synthase III C-terminal domain-containing protein [Eubacteriales bacterium]|nr:3-oxoacyl-[acyl-carrier-protein] synthase III C-terminal domain-containing protein [Eubacteriales bacterium]
MIKETLEKVNLQYKDINHILFSQINKSVIEEVMKIIELPLGEFGYTGSGCMPMAIDVALKANRIKKGDIVVLVASGARLRVACTVLRW